jgi:BirA family biotin operon repressor/biotin-[acetyl-CoA-carboxylase] ligase
MFDPVPSDVAAAVGAAASRVGRFGRLKHCAEVDSTNDIALALAVAGEPEGTTVLADFQRRGRGRRGRDWFSPAGAGLYLSTIVRPAGRTSAVPLLTLGAGVAVAGAVQAITRLPVELKWPNDLVIGRPWRKLGGVLSEAAGHGASVEAIVVGVGVNLLAAAYPKEIVGRATSIETELGRPIERAPLVAELLARLHDVVSRLHDGHHDTICREWRRFAEAGLAGAGVCWHDRDRERRGRARDIDRDGALIVEADGRIERVVAGEVTWEGFSRG